MQKHSTREIEAAADAQSGSAIDAVAAAIQFVRTIAEDHAASRAKSPLESRFGAEKIAAAVDDAISSVAESSMAEYVQQIVRGAGPPARQQFSLGNQLTWSPGRALPQFLFQGKPILLTDPEQVVRWDRLAKQEAQENAPGPMAQIFKAQRNPTPPDIATKLEKSAAGKITFRSADRPGWDKVIYYHAGEKGAAERLAEILRNNQELTEQQQAEVWRLEGWPEADITRELERMRNVQRMHDESWWTPPPSLMERAGQCAKGLLSFGRAKEIARPFAKAEPKQAQRPPREIQQSPEQVAELPRGALLNVEVPAETRRIGGKADVPPPRSVIELSNTAGLHRTDWHAAARPDLDRGRANDDAKITAGVTRKDAPIFRWLDAAMEEVHRSSQHPRRRTRA